MLRELKSDVEKYRNDKDSYYKRYPIRNCLKSPNYRKWNYNRFIYNELDHFSDILQIKDGDVIKEKNKFNTIVNDNLGQSFNVEAQRKLHLYNQSTVNLKSLYTSFRRKRNGA